MDAEEKAALDGSKLSDCWCNEISGMCVNCESRMKYKSLSYADKKLVGLFEKNYTLPAMRNNINKFEERHQCDWTDFVRFKNE